ncbi:MAG: hypothetical protein LUE88_06350, partial [Clostridiales bacterium]|nr:hypothetical protein [Clostridiales bacterium]
PIINAADGMAVRIERSVYEDDFIDSKGSTDVTAIKGMTSAMKELVGVIRNVNELPTKAERDAAAMSREKTEADRRRGAGDEIRIVIEGGDLFSG